MVPVWRRVPYDGMDGWLYGVLVPICIRRGASNMLTKRLVGSSKRGFAHYVAEIWCGEGHVRRGVQHVNVIGERLASGTPDRGSATPKRAPRRDAYASSGGSIAQLGGMALMAAQAVTRAVKPPFDYGPELVAQVRTVLAVSFFPLLLVAFALSFGPAGVQASNFFGLFGAYDRMGSAWQIVVTRLFAPMTTAIVLAGTAGTAICADLGARKVREEIDALSVLGVDVIKGLVTPRVIVLVGAALVFNAFAMLAGMLGAVLVLAQHGEPVSPFFYEYLAAANLTELTAAFIKVSLYGAVIAVVSCYKGMTVSGGPEGVGRAVNSTVVVSFLAIAVIEYSFDAFVLATNPALSIPRG